MSIRPYSPNSLTPAGRAYLRLQERSTEFTASQVRQMLRAYMKTNRLTQKALACRIGVSPPFVNDILLAKREPSGLVLTFLKLRRAVVYRRANPTK